VYLDGVHENIRNGRIESIVGGVVCTKIVLSMNIIDISSSIVDKSLVSFRAVAKVVLPGLRLDLNLVILLNVIIIIIIVVVGAVAFEEYFKGVRGINRIFKENVLVIPLLDIDELEIIFEEDGFRGAPIGANEVCGNNGNIASVNAIEAAKGVSITTIVASGTNADDVVALFEIDTGGPTQVIDKGEIPLTIEQEAKIGNAIGTRREYETLIDVPLIEDLESINRRHFVSV
jgi:hypothetical protein